MLFAHIADTHLGYRQFNLEEREKDFYSAFHEAIDKMIAEGVDVVIHAGDLFEEPRPPIRALVEAKKGIERLKEKGIKVVMIPGNHDILMRKWSLVPHAIFDGIEVLTTQRPYVIIDDVFIGGVPYFSKSYRDVLLENLAALEKEAKNFKRSILVIHQGIDKYLPYEHELEIGELPKSFSYYALGHVHMRIEDEYGSASLCYPGSTEMWRIDEIRDWKKNGKGFLVSDTKDMRPRRISLESTRPFLKAEIGSEEDIHSIKEKMIRYKDPVLSLTLSSEEDFNYLCERVKSELLGALYIALRKKPLLKEETLVKGGAVNIRGLIYDALEGVSEDEKTYSFEAFKLLSKNDIEGAISLSEDFYERWKRGSG